MGGGRREESDGQLDGEARGVDAEPNHAVSARLVGVQVRAVPAVGAERQGGVCYGECGIHPCSGYNRPWNRGRGIDQETSETGNRGFFQRWT